ncbi:MAG: amino acid permease [Candidatus Eremiobacteraeota bacterium]|nr:amino acid permease [Candidatus Eremiobacteraeota bacterium]
MLARRLNAFDATLIVLGGIVGVGIFQNPSVVAARAHTPGLIMAAWLFGGIVALAGGFVFAELAWRRPDVGGLYVYMRDAYHPALAFMYGWTALLVMQSGGMALAAITFAFYVAPHVHTGTSGIAVAVLIIFSAINCVGVREGGSMQNVLMLLKLATIAVLVGVGFVVSPNTAHATASLPALPPVAFLALMGGALIPVLYAYDGWQTASFLSGELKEPARSLPRGLVWGVLIVIVLYIAVNLTALRVLGAAGLAATNTPASDIMRHAIGPAGEWVIAAFIALSALGFLSNQILTSPRIYFAMAQDGLFFSQVAWLHPTTRSPVVAIALQGLAAIIITVSGRYDQILNYVTSMDFVFFALAAVALFRFKRATDVSAQKAPGMLVPGHPWTTLFFIGVSVAIVLNSWWAYPGDTLKGVGILLVGGPVYYLWRAWGAKAGIKREIGNK